MDYFNPYQYPTRPIQPQFVQQKSNLDWITVASISQVEQVNVNAGSKAWIMVQNEPIFALRTADNMGLVTTEYYKFEKYEPMNAKNSINTNDYVTRDEMLAEIKKAMEGAKLNESTTKTNKSNSKCVECN